MFLVAWLAAGAASEEVVWIEAEQFQNHGGWTNDAQFIDQMGSPYLLASGLGTPVEDAVTTVRLPRAGTYRLWVRAKDWVPEHHPGLFEVAVGGRTVDHVFGGSGRKGWIWEDGGVHELSGDVELRLHDLTGYYARCDAVVLAGDPQWTPPGDQAAIAALRERHGGVSRDVQDGGEFDVVVVGGGLAGCTAAVTAARLGAATVLIQNRPVLGGNASTEILVPPVGVWPHRKRDPLDPRETGLVEEYRTEGNQTNAEAAVYSARLLRLVQAEPNLTLCLNTHATGVEMRREGGRAIASVLALDARSGRRLRFAGRVFLDCTGDAVVGVAAGAEYRHGKEPRAMYNEPWAPETPSTNTMGNTLKYASVDAGAPQAFAAPPWAMKFPTCESFSAGRHPFLGARTGDQWMIELGGLGDTYADAEQIRDDLLRLIFGLWDHLKNHCPREEQTAANHRLAWVGHVAGKRENRRLIGDYVLTENDIRQQTLFPDRVAYGGWCLDDHHSGGFFHQGSFGIHYDRPGGLDPCMGLLYSIPYRSLYSKNVDNLLMAGRDISVSHMALSDTRVMLTCAVIGQAAGTAAALSVQHGTTPRGVYQEHLEQLQQQLLKDGAWLIDLPNRDPRDLARSAAVTASSELTRADGELMAAANVINGLARASGGKTNAWSPQPAVPDALAAVGVATGANVQHGARVVRDQDARAAGVSRRGVAGRRVADRGRSAQLPATAVRAGVGLDHHRQTPLRIYRHDQRRGNPSLRRTAAAGRDRAPRAGGRRAAGRLARPALVLQRGSAKTAGPGHRRKPSRADRQLGRVHICRALRPGRLPARRQRRQGPEVRSASCPTCPAPASTKSACPTSPTRTGPATSPLP